MGADKEEEAMQGPSCCEERILVSVRLRPLNEKEIARNDVSDWECINDDTIVFQNSLSVAERSLYPTTYTFDRVYRSDCSTRQVYEEGAKEVALSVIRGINSSIFAYGQTSSGKTFTMNGITQYSIADIYDYIERHKEREFVLKFSALEIYNESVRDLLSADTTPLRVLDDPEKGTIVEKLTEETLRNWNHFKELLSVCKAQRQIGETALNETSSRSHQILRLTIENSAREFLGNDKSSTLIATVNFVDLAGSERASQSLSAGTRLKEGNHINRSLLTLGTVIRKLSKGRTRHVPFRDSKLTRILQSSLGSNARTAIICTMSPARSHVEQSRNTLLFACCAKEVTTNAQVNVVMSDKALVKHLQKELARMENEMRNPGPTSIASELTALLREKDLQIEKLKKEVAELTRQRDLSLSQVEDLRVVGDDGNSEIWADLDQQYPKLRVRNSWGSSDQLSETAVLQDPYSLVVRSFNNSQYSDVQSRTDSDESFLQLPGLKVNYLHGDTSPQLSTNISSFAETEEQSNDDLEDLYKDVQCIKMERRIMDRHVDSNVISLVQNTGEEDNELESPPFNGDIVSIIELENGDGANQELGSPQLKEDIGLGLGVESRDGPNQELRSTPLKGDTEVRIGTEEEGRENEEFGSPPLKENEELIIETKNGDRKYQGLGSHPLKEDNESSSVYSVFVTPSPETPSPWLLENNMSSPRSLRLTRSRSCIENLMPSSPSSWFKTAENNQCKPPIWYEKDLTGKPEGFQRKLPALKCGANNERLSRNSSQTSLGNVAVDEFEVQSVKDSSDEKISSISTPVAGMKEMSSLQHSMQLTDHAELETEPKPSLSAKNVKHVGVDPILDDLESSSKWPSEFKRLQREIIDLWHACHASLVHRAYFFLLFKGDPKDSIYMEVELRRMTFLKDTFTYGNHIVEDGRTLTLASRVRALRRERQMLSMRMQKRLSEEDREFLFLKWGIRLNTKNRKLQLANRLWTDMKDIEHITESANIVAKLVGIVEPEKAFREMFGLDFTPHRRSKTLNMWI